MYKVPLSVPSIKGNEWKYVKDCLDTEWVSSAGNYVDLFEKKVAEYTRSRFAVACVNGTSALQLSLKLVGVKPGDEVLVPTLTFIAPVNAISYNGAKPIFMDADKYYNIDTEKTIDFIQNETELRDVGNEYPITINKKTGCRIAAIICVHVWGNAVYLDELLSICNKRNIKIVEDASESLGTFYNNGKNKSKHTGTIGTLGCLSFNGNKIITTGGGGMILTNDIELNKKARYLTTQAKDDPVRYVHNEVGYNFRLTNIQSALGLAQLEQLPVFINRKKEIHTKYISILEEISGLRLAEVPKYSNNNYWMNILKINQSEYGISKDKLMQKMNDAGIQTRPVWALNHLQKPYKSCQNYKIEYAANLIDISLCLPSSANLLDKHINYIAKSLTER